MLTGLLAPSSGSVEVLGIDFAVHPVEVKRQIGVVPEGMGLFERLTGTDYLRFVGTLCMAWTNKLQTGAPRSCLSLCSWRTGPKP